MEQISKNLKLRVEKRTGKRKNKISFYVVDAHIQRYPSNFICNLPMCFNKNLKGDVSFVRIFGLNVDLALSLLNQARKDYEGDADITEEIWRRIRLFNREKVVK
jgi:hypothetical protein